MTSYYLMTDEASDVDLDSLLERVTAGVQRLTGRSDVEVTMSNNGVFWVVSRTTTFIVRISSRDMIVSDADDLAAFSSDDDQRQNVVNATTRFICHHQGDETRTAELNYLISVLRDGHQGWCFRIDDRHYVSTEFDEAKLREKQRLPVRLKAAGWKRTILTRVFAEPIPLDLSGEVAFLNEVTDIQPDLLDAFAIALTQSGYGEVEAAENADRTFAFMTNVGWQLQVNFTRTEICFSIPQGTTPNQNILFEAYQTCSELIGNMPLRVYDAQNDSWVDF